MPVAMGERLVSAGRNMLGWTCSVALVWGVAITDADAQERAPADAQATTLAGQAAIALGAATTAPEAAGEAPAAEPPKEKAADDDAGETSGLIDFFKTTELTGFVDAYYGWNFNRVGPVLRNFDVNHNEFSFNLAEVALEKKPTADSRVGFRVDFDAGRHRDW